MVDRNARSVNAPINMVARPFFGQLQQILQVNLPAMPSGREVVAPQTILLAVIQDCEINEATRTQAEIDLDIRYITRMGALQVVDLQTVQCVVGRVKDRGKYAIIDRSGTLARAIFVDDDGDSV